MDEYSWTTDTVVQLVTEYMRNSELWDKDHDLHHVHNAKYEAWSRIAKKFGCDIADLKKKMTSILASYRREKGKVRAGVKSTWFLYPYLKFLPGYVPTVKKTNYAAPTQVTRNESPEPTQEFFTMETEAEDEDMNPDYTVEEEEVMMIKQEPGEPTPKKKIKNIGNKKHCKRMIKRVVPDTVAKQPATQTDGKLLEMLRLLKKSDISKKKDECDSFGEYIATTLRKHDNRTQSMIKQAINNILFEQEMKKYSHEYVELNDDVNPLDHEREDD